jgi:histidinol-phosphate aminotransferase
MKSLVTPNIEGLVPYQGGKPIEEVVREFGVKHPIKLASNENPLGPSPRGLEAARAALAEVGRYPDGAGFRLRSAIADFHGVSLDEVLHGNGSNELIELLVRAFTTPAHHIVFSEPAFVMYRVASMAQGVASSAVPTRRFKPDVEGLLAAVRDNTRIILVDNPNNPTGAYLTLSEVEHLLRSVPPDVIVVMDEAYFEYADAADYPNSLKLRHLRERLVVLRTFSKIYGLAGLRVGYGIAPAMLFSYANRIRAPFNVGVASQEAGIAALTDVEHVNTSRKLNREQRARLAAALSERGIEVTPSQANFVLSHFGRPAAPLYDALLRLGVIVRPFARLPESLRITVGTEAQNDRLLSAIDAVLR